VIQFASIPVDCLADWNTGSLGTEKSFMQDFRNIDAWKKAHNLVLSIYRETLSLPKEEVFGVTIQLRRTATSVATRIAEGTGRSALQSLPEIFVARL
jgi:hypothetical protein